MKYAIHLFCKIEKGGVRSYPASPSLISPIKVACLGEFCMHLSLQVLTTIPAAMAVRKGHKEGDDIILFLRGQAQVSQFVRIHIHRNFGGRPGGIDIPRVVEMDGVLERLEIAVMRIGRGLRDVP